MLIIRCTRKLLARIGPPISTCAFSTTRLGDWYAQPLAVGDRRYVLLASQHSRLPVLMPGRDLKHLAHNFPEALFPVLQALDLPRAAIVAEIAETRTVVITTTNSRSLLGTLNDFSFLLKAYLRDRPDADLLEAALWLSRTPVGPLKHETPERVTRHLLSGELAIRPVAGVGAASAASVKWLHCRGSVEEG